MFSQRSISGRCVVDLRDVDGASVRDDDVFFSAQQLHDRSRFGWAVIGYPSGAIAERGGGTLLLRLRQDEARDIAVAMSRTAETGSTEH